MWAAVGTGKQGGGLAGNEEGCWMPINASLTDGWLPAPNASLLTSPAPPSVPCPSLSPCPLPQAWLDPFLRETVSGMLLWPRRMVVPLLPEEQTGPLDELYLRWVGGCTAEVFSCTAVLLCCRMYCLRCAAGVLHCLGCTAHSGLHLRPAGRQPALLPLLVLADLPSLPVPFCPCCPC